MVTVVSRFRLFGRPDSAADDGAAEGPVDGPPGAGVPRQRSAPPTGAWAATPPGPPMGGWSAAPPGPPPIGAGAPWPAPATTGAWPVGTGPVTSACRPAIPLTSRDARVVGDPPTDPYGFPPVPAFTPAAPDPAEAAALAGAFAVDYLSWDEDDPERRGRVLVDYLPTPGRDPSRLGWSGLGRQRAEFALPGLVRPDGDGRVLVDVRVRVTPYRTVGEHGPGTDDEHAVAGAPAAAPAPTGRGWRSLASTWIRLSVPVTLDGGRLVVDAWEETLGEEPPPPPRPAPTGDDHTLADDDPLQDALPGGGW